METATTWGETSTGNKGISTREEKGRDARGRLGVAEEAELGACIVALRCGASELSEQLTFGLRSSRAVSF